MNKTKEELEMEIKSLREQLNTLENELWKRNTTEWAIKWIEKNGS